MPRRRLTSWLLAAAALAAGAAAGRASDGTTELVYRLRPDPRMCPSPICGGYFVLRVGGGTTTCHDGVKRPACYVAALDLRALPGPARARAAAVPAGSAAIAEGAFAPYEAVPKGRLAALVARSVWHATGSSGDPGGPIYRVADTGLRCIRAPCFSLRATPVNTTRSLRLSDVDLGAAGLTPASSRRAAALLAHGGVLVSGTLRPVTDPSSPTPGRVLDASQVWLPV
jgi:hypothetical protein